MKDQTQLLRQIHPSFVQDGKITSQAFRPTPKDDKKLSCYDGSRISAEGAFNHFVKSPECRSAGVMAVTVMECTAMDLPVVPDPVAFAEHILIDFAAFEKREVERKAKLLRALAESRDCLFKPL